ncbi:MAG: hypothetical protein AAB499_02560 [Patescibacteria group bacterium]
MPRDLDFRRRPDRSVARIEVASQPARRRGRRQPPIIASAMLLFILITFGSSFLYQGQSPDPLSDPTAISTKSTAISATDQGLELTANESLPTAINSPIQIYNAGAGEEAVTALIQQLAKEGITVKNLGRSQFEFDQSFIWHQPELVTKAQEIAAKLGRQFTLKESKIAGGFEILIYLGKD